jgi:phosphoglycerate dehydrogenase-like enzyme
MLDRQIGLPGPQPKPTAAPPTNREARVFIQAIGAGTDQFPRDELAKRGLRLASARGGNYRACRGTRDGAHPGIEPPAS